MCVPPVGTHSARGLLTAWCQQTAALDCAASARHTTRPCACAQVAQSAEQGTENPRVGGSIPPLGIFSAGLRDRSGPPQPTAAHESLHTAGQDRAPVFAGGFRFSTGLPGRMKCSLTPLWYAQASSVLLVNSSPLL